MTLQPSTTDSGPGNSDTTNSGPGYAKHPGYRVDLEPCPKRLRIVFGGETIADTTAVMLLHETKHIPVYYFPRADVRMDLLAPTDHTTFCPFKGTASYYTLAAGDRRAENAVWTYPTPFDEVPEIKDYLAFYWGKVDHWYEEDEEVFVHARDPYKRIDIVDSSRPVRIVLGGETVAESTRARFLFETGLPTRYYLPAEDVGAALTPSATRTACPYKGTASYWSVKAGDQVFEDIVWFYADPVPEAVKIKDRVCFFNEKVDAIEVDGVVVPKQQSPWS